MKKLILGSVFFSLFLVGCSSTPPQPEPEPVEEIIIVEPVQVGKEFIVVPVVNNN